MRSAIIRVGRSAMSITHHQVGSIIRAYLRNKREALADLDYDSNHIAEVKDEICLSDEGRTILFERMGQHVAEKAQTDTSST
jgi:hypothetical protein